MSGKTCGVCGAKLAHFENPDRDVCPRESEHRHIERLKGDTPRPRPGWGGKRKGAGRPKGTGKGKKGK